MYEYVENFKRLGFGLFTHFGLYSVLGKGEWYLSTGGIKPEKYEKLAEKFNPSKTWAKELVSVAKKAGCRYINVTARHHDGFSLYDTRGLSDYDTAHFCGRDLMKEFTDACFEGGLTPFFYHTLLDWRKEEYKTDFPKYIDYLVQSVEILCKNYGKVGGFWFDGFWDKPNADWQFDRLYKTIRKYQPEAMIINNTGLSALGKVSHREIDSVTFERGKPFTVSSPERPIAGEMCEVITDHWGYCKDDICYKTPPALIEELIDCRSCGCNFLLNAGLTANGKIPTMEREILFGVGKWIKRNKNFIYCAPSEIKAENADVFYDGKHYYAAVKKVPMSLDENVTKAGELGCVKILTEKKAVNAVWLDDHKKIRVGKDNSFAVAPFEYGTSLFSRVARFTLK